jgi:hypothetical protein
MATNTLARRDSAASTKLNSDTDGSPSNRSVDGKASRQESSMSAEATDQRAKYSPRWAFQWIKTQIKIFNLGLLIMAIKFDLVQCR